MKKNNSFSSIYKLAWPAIISHATVMLVSAIDLAFIGRLGNATIAIAAAAIANNVCAAVYSFLEGIRSGTTVLTARYLGAKEPDNITKTLNMALISAIFIGITLLLIAPFVIKFIYNFVGDDQIAKLGYPYLTIRLIGMPFHLIIFAIIGLFRGLKNTLIPLVITITICLIDAILDYAFMYGKWGFPVLGMNGIAIATASAYILGAIFSIFLLFKVPLTRKYLNFKTSCKSIFKTFLKIGIEIGLYSGVVILALFIFVFIFTALGPQALAAHQIVFQVFLVTYLTPMGFFVAASILVGKLIGEHHHKQIIPITIKIWLSSLPLVGSICLIIAIMAPYIATFFSPQNSAVSKLATNSIYLICLMQIVSSIYLVIKGALTAAKDTRFIFIAGTITSYGFFLPLAYILGIKCGYGVLGGYIAFLIWSILDAIVFSWRFFVQKPWLFINSHQKAQ